MVRAKSLSTQNVVQGLFQLSVPWWELMIRAVLVYGALLFLLRLTGKRQVGDLAPFDLVLLLILSNAVQNAMNAGDESALGGIILAVTLVGLNHVVGYLTYRSRKMEDVLEGTTDILVRDGQPVAEVLERQRITERELLTALRQHGVEDILEVRLAILENNGKVSVFRREADSEA